MNYYDFNAKGDGSFETFYGSVDNFEFCHIKFCFGALTSCDFSDFAVVYFVSGSVFYSNCGLSFDDYCAFFVTCFSFFETYAGFS